MEPTSPQMDSLRPPRIWRSISVVDGVAILSVRRSKSPRVTILFSKSGAASIPLTRLGIRKVPST